MRAVPIHRYALNAYEATSPVTQWYGSQLSSPFGCQVTVGSGQNAIALIVRLHVLHSILTYM